MMICYDPKMDMCRVCLPNEKQHYQTMMKCERQIKEERKTVYIPPEDQVPTPPKPEKPTVLNFFKNIFKGAKF